MYTEIKKREVKQVKEIIAIFLLVSAVFKMTVAYSTRKSGMSIYLTIEFILLLYIFKAVGLF